MESNDKTPVLQESPADDGECLWCGVHLPMNMKSQHMHEAHPNPPQFLPATQGPLRVFSVADRIKDLESLLADNSCAAWHGNIRTVIQLYKDGKIKEDGTYYIQAGKVYDRQPDYITGSAIWVEQPSKIHYQMALTHPYRRMY